MHLAFPCAPILVFFTDTAAGAQAAHVKSDISRDIYGGRDRERGGEREREITEKPRGPGGFGPYFSSP
jgi:hypothetical protein